MRRPLLITVAITGAALLPASASAEIVKAPTGESSTMNVSAAQQKTWKKHKLKLAASGSAKAASRKLTLPYSLSRWDFTTHEGDVAYFAKDEGFKLTLGKRKAVVTHPRFVLDDPKTGYVTVLIANERIKFFTVSGAAAKASDSGNVQSITGYTLKLTQAGANYVNKALHKKALKRFSQWGTMDLRLIRPASSGGGAGGGGGTPGQGDTPGGTLTVAPSFTGLLPG